MQMLTTASRLDWGSWVRGVIGSFVSGGSAAIGAAAAITAFDPSHDIVGVKMFEVMGAVFTFSGLVSMAKFLQTHPVPDVKP